MELEDEWMNFNDDDIEREIQQHNISNTDHENKEFIVPKSSDIYISTKTKICYLNKEINLYDIFWKLNLINYYEMREGIIKKQMKFNSLERDTYEKLLKLVEEEKKKNFVEETLIQHTDLQSGNKIRFKDIRKVSIGISKKDILSYRSKPKSAFYNCFVILGRINYKYTYKEVHIKIFNTGKVEIPGLQEDYLFERTKKFILDNLKIYDAEIDFIPDKTETVLINSNFSCGYLINRDSLFNKLKNKYKINASYDPCSYPGIQCKYKITEDDKEYQVSFMIFRTGSVLIVGKCNESVLISVYKYLKEILYNEYFDIYQEGDIQTGNKEKKTKIRKKKITLIL